MPHLTDALIKRLPVPVRGNRVTYDDVVKGFGVRITAGGARAFVLNYVNAGGRERRLTIGQCGVWSTVAGREEARRLRQEIDRGVDPLADAEARREAPTVAELAARFEAEHLPRLRPSTREAYRSYLRVHVLPEIGSMKVAEVQFSDIDRLHRAVTRKRKGPVGGAYTANRVAAVLGKMFSLAVRWGLRSDNPAKAVPRNPEHARRRYLKPAELPRLLDAMNAHPDRASINAIRMLLLTGARRGEVLGMRWADYDQASGVWSKPAATTKQDKPHDVPLSAPARALLAELAEEPRLPMYVFPGGGSVPQQGRLKRAWASVCHAAGIEGLRIHDLRHSFASQLVSGGASLPLIGALLGHSNPKTTARYAHLYDDPLRAAVERVGAAVIAAESEPPPAPLPFKPRGSR